jgi:hypothetical protein
MKLITVKQLMKKSKTALIRKITKSLKAMPKKKLAMLCYEMTKSKLPRLTPMKRYELGEKMRNIQYMKGYKTYRGTSKPLNPDYKYMLNKKGELRAVLKSEFKKYKLGKTLVKKKRKFSAKQLAAQRLFAKRARAGTLRRRKR